MTAAVTPVVLDRPTFLAVVAQIPEPAEPTGLGALVLAGNGELYIRPKLTTIRRHWKNVRGRTDHTKYAWENLPRPLILVAPGVEVAR